MKDLSNDVEYMKEYLKHALEMEVHKYTWEEALNEAKSQRNTNEATQKTLKQQQITADQQIGLLKQESLTRKKAATDNTMHYTKRLILFGIALLLSIFSAIFGFKLLNNLDSYGNIYLAQICIAPLVVSIIFLIKSFKHMNRQKSMIDESSYTDIIDKINRWNYSKSSAIKQLPTIEKALPAIKASEKEISKELAEANDALTKIYSNNVLPMKYRNLASVATLYEYLENKRCNTISGPGGIYDTYVHDQQLGTINENLNEIKYAVNNVYEAQFYLYEELTTANEHLKDIKKEIGSIRQSSERAADNSAIGAEASRQSADMLNWWNWTRKF